MGQISQFLPFANRPEKTDRNDREKQPANMHGSANERD